jgi:hypothetical protein
MKKFLVFTLVLTMIFPAYCFATPQKSISLEQAIMEEVQLILEDGIVEEGEINDLIARYQYTNIIDINQDDPTRLCDLLSRLASVLITTGIVELSILFFFTYPSVAGGSFYSDLLYALSSLFCGYLVRLIVEELCGEYLAESTS